MKKPKHKVLKKKYFNKKGQIQYKRDNSPLTKEDNFSMFDMPWLSSLRDRAHSVQQGKSGKKKQPLISTVPNPPSFYDDEMDKWKNKFKKVTQERRDFKKKYLKDTKTGIEVAPGDKIMKLVQGRRQSRLSTNTFNNIDFEYNGNTTQLSHMIKKELLVLPIKYNLTSSSGLDRTRARLSASIRITGLMLSRSSTTAQLMRLCSNLQLGKSREK